MTTLRFPSYRQWKAWRGIIPALHLRLCFVCHRPLQSTDGLATKRVIGGKAAAFGGNGRETIGYHTPEDRIKAGCTVKIKQLASRTVTPAQVITAYGRTWDLPESVEEKFTDKLMTMSVSGIGCEVCRVLADMSDRKWVDVSSMVLDMDPNDAPVQEQMSSHGYRRQEPHGVRTVCNDNIRRVKEQETVAGWIAPVIEDDAITGVGTSSTVKVTTASVPDARLKKEHESLIYWMGPRKVMASQSVAFIADQAYRAAVNVAHMEQMRIER